MRAPILDNYGLIPKTLSLLFNTSAINGDGSGQIKIPFNGFMTEYDISSIGSLGDNAQVRIVDIDNILGNGPNYVVSMFCNIRMPQTDYKRIEIPYIFKVWKDLYIKVDYDSDPLEAKRVVANFHLHQTELDIGEPV